MFTYAVALTPAEEGGFIVTFPDVPGAITEGDDTEEALARAVDALETMFIGLMDSRKDLPLPSAPQNRPTITLPPISAAKVALYRAMREAGITKAALARRLGVPIAQLDRLLDLRRSSRMEQLDSALRSLGKALVVEVMDAA
jgi:antitoxin HicB